MILTCDAVDLLNGSLPAELSRTCQPTVLTWAIYEVRRNGTNVHTLGSGLRPDLSDWGCPEELSLGLAAARRLALVETGRIVPGGEADGLGSGPVVLEVVIGQPAILRVSVRLSAEKLEVGADAVHLVRRLEIIELEPVFRGDLRRHGLVQRSAAPVKSF